MNCNHTFIIIYKAIIFSQVDVQMFLGGLAVFLTPSQLVILQSVIEKLLMPSTDPLPPDSKKCGKPMKQTDFARVEHQLQGDLEAKALWRTDFSSGKVLDDVMSQKMMKFDDGIKDKEDF